MDIELDSAQQHLQLKQRLQQALDNADNGWSIGSFGAIGEFTRDADEAFQPLPEKLQQQGWQGLITGRGALAFQLNHQIRPLAYEYPGRAPGSWQQGLMLCMPAAEINYIGATPGKVRYLRELGHDADALQPDAANPDSAQRLFDMGLGQANVDVAIRTDNPDLIAILRQHLGKDLLAPGNPAMAAIIAHGPTRVFTSECARMEIYQPIGIHKTPEGPHTHVLPKLLASGLLCSANIPLPQGYQPVLSLHPAHPCRDLLGQPIAFDVARFQCFEQDLESHARRQYWQAKQALRAALTAGVPAAEFTPGSGRLAKTAVRVALRQQALVNQQQSDQQSNLLSDYIARFDPQRRAQSQNQPQKSPHNPSQNPPQKQSQAAVAHG